MLDIILTIRTFSVTYTCAMWISLYIISKTYNLYMLLQSVCTLVGRLYILFAHKTCCTIPPCHTIWNTKTFTVAQHYSNRWIDKIVWKIPLKILTWFGELCSNIELLEALPRIVIHLQITSHASNDLFDQPRKSIERKHNLRIVFNLSEIIADNCYLKQQNVWKNHNHRVIKCF